MTSGKALGLHLYPIHHRGRLRLAEVLEGASFTHQDQPSAPTPLSVCKSLCWSAPGLVLHPAQPVVVGAALWAVAAVVTEQVASAWATTLATQLLVGLPYNNPHLCPLALYVVMDPQADLG